MGGYEHQADYGIITALRDELAALRAALTGVEEVQLGTSDIRYYYRGRLSCRDGSEVTVVCACSSEMGQQPALNVTRDLIAAWKPRHVFLVGIAGGFPGRGTFYGDVVVPLRVHYYEPGKLIPNSVGPDGAQRGRIPRWRTFTTSARLSSAVEALAVEAADWLRRVSVPRPDGGEQKPQILRDELASGEEVWASLESPITQEVLSRSDKILAVENEASGFLSAVLESPRPPDALVIKALSDLVAGKDDRWRAFAASASAAFAVAVIEKLGARWRSEGSTSGQADKSSGEGEEWTIPSDHQRLLDEADTLVGQSRYRDAREKLRLVLQAAKPGSPAAISARIDLAEIQLFEGSEVVAAREALSTCLREIRGTDLKRRQTALALLGDAEALLGHVGEAHSLFLEARSLARERKSRFAEGHALVGLSRTEELRGNLAEAERLIDDAIGLYRAEYREASSDDSRRKAATNIAAGLSTRAHLLTHGGRLTEALVCLENALPLFKEAGSQDNIGRTLLLKAQLLLTEAKWQDGLTLLQEAGLLFQAAGNTEWECRCLRHMSRLMAMSGRPDMAWGSLSHAVSLLTSSHWPAHARVPYLLDLAHLAWDIGRHDDAGTRIEEAKELARQSEPDGTLADCFVAEASTVRGTGETEKVARLALFEAATQDLDAALARCEIRGRRAVFMERLGTLHGYREDVGQARTWFERAFQEFESIGDVSGVARCLASIAAAARADNAHAEALETLERALEVTKTLPLYHERAGALHDLALLRLSQCGDVGGAKRCLDEARRLAEKHGFRDVLDALQSSTERVEHAERLGQPSERDLASVVDELQTWCARFPSMRDAIVPLWYFVHRTDLWSICRAMLGLKFLIRTDDRKGFDRVLQVLRSHGDLFVFARPFPLARKSETELVPWPSDVLIPPHLSIVLFEKGSDPRPNEATAQAIVNTLKDRPYVLMPFSEPQRPDGVDCYALGHHLRLPDCVTEMMLDPATIAMKQVCLPLGESKIGPGETDDDQEDVDLRDIMLVAWENGMLPVLVERLPPADEVKVVAATAIALCPPGRLSEESDARKARLAWSNFVRGCRESPREAIEEFRDRWMELSRSGSGGEHVVHAVAYVLQFHAGPQQITYPAVVFHSEGRASGGHASS